jgi:hypothetical protein
MIDGSLWLSFTTVKANGRESARGIKAAIALRKV